MDGDFRHTSSMALQDPQPTVRTRCVAAVIRIEPMKVPDLFAEVKKHRDDKVRLSAYQGLNMAQPGVKVALSPLMDALADSSPQIRIVATQGLGNIGADAKAAVPRLTELLSDANPTVRTWAQRALKQIQGK